MLFAMPRKAFRKPLRATFIARATIALLSALVVLQTFWHTPSRSLKSSLESDTVDAATVAATRATKLNGSQAAESSRQAQIDRLVAQVATVCPTSAMQLREELTAATNLAPDHKPTSLRTASAQARITGIRVAQRETLQRETRQHGSISNASGRWLIDPEYWYAPEDKRTTSHDASIVDQSEAAPASRNPSNLQLRSEPEEPIGGESLRSEGPVTVAPPSPPEPRASDIGFVGPRVAEPEPPVGVPLEPQRMPETAPPIVQPPEALVNPVGQPQPQPMQQNVELRQPALSFEPPSTAESSDADFPPTSPSVPRSNKSLFAPPQASSNRDLGPSALAAPDSPVVVPDDSDPLSGGPWETLPAPQRSPEPKPIARPTIAPLTPPADESLGFGPPPAGVPRMHGGADPQGMEQAWQKAREAGVAEGEDPHTVLLAEGCYPSAKTCAKCHEKVYNEWSCSSHAYAAISPMFHKFEQKITEVSMGTVGYFCLRCHSPVGTHLNLPRDLPLWEQPEVAREGVTCIACHRVNQRYGKSNGERHIVPGDIYAPVYGGKGGVGVAQVIAKKDHYKIKTSPDEKGPGQAIHREGRYFDQLSASEYCTTCHQVAVHPGIKLEVVWEQYRASPARKAGITCQDCHMGKTPGVPSGYEYCAIAEVAGKKVRENVKHSNHTFYGPGYSIAHPGIFPFHLKADRWKLQEWLSFDWRAGWGTDEFEDRVADGEICTQFPAVWAEADDRYDAREIIDDNLERLAGKTEIRKQVMENGSHVDGPFFATTPSVGQDLKLHYLVANTNSGHNLPTASLGAQPQLWANVVLIGPGGQRLWETGYTDQYGDVCDIHSRDVRQGRTPFDSQLFNLQTMFLITGATGTDREFYLPVNVDFDQLPFLRPGAIPISVTNHPPFIRMESRSIAPLGKKRVKYSVPGKLLCEPGRYRLSFRMRSRAEPIYFMDFCGATTEMQRAMNEGIIDVHPYAVEFDVR